MYMYVTDASHTKKTESGELMYWGVKEPRDKVRPTSSRSQRYKECSDLHLVR
jgi:hypothetical protein